MAANSQAELSSNPLTIRIHLTDGSVHSFAQSDSTIIKKLWSTIEPARLFTQRRIIVGSEHSKSVFVAAEITRVDFVHDSLEGWPFPYGYTDIVELSEEEFHRQARLGEPSQMVRRDRPNPVGDLLVSFIKLHLRGSPPLFVMVEIFAKLPALVGGVSDVAQRSRARGRAVNQGLRRAMVSLSTGRRPANSPVAARIRGIFARAARNPCSHRRSDNR